ncbi:hypothetical protein LOTGIDRAFT_153726 [Lottia gigantea]|uniref:PR domain zinc finger protein 2 n=1 Tax=Lottia gigantea TaxID=225164 RepID=V3ZJ07_LOTGI|nr:hypothetical protein LOTGIDRAFT_153726 [Lottia gigantea]ESO91293.1 hypothetical protein LOTGIDRAFT_153726 [Lottia gigantea]
MEEVQNLEKPNEVEFRPSEVEIGKQGIWCIKKIKEGTLFGPYCGEIVLHDKQGLLDYRYAWEVWDLESDKLLYIINADKKNIGNWMKYVNCARYFEEQNIVSVQIDNEIYYKAIKDIEIGEELLTWFNLIDKNDDSLILPMEEEKKKHTKKMPSPKKSPKKSPMKAISTQTSPSKTKIASTSPAKRKSPSNMDASTSNSKKQKFVQTRMNFKISKKPRDKTKKNVENETVLNNVNSNSMNGETTEEVAKQLLSKDDKRIFRFHTQKKHHFVQDGKKMYKCELCSVVYKRPFSLKRHFLRSHINCMYLCETDVTNCCIDLDNQLMQIENAQNLQASGSCLFNGLIRSHTSSPMQDEKLIESDSKLNKKDSKTQEIDSSFPGLYKCNDCFFVFDDSKDLVAHFKCHDSKIGTKTPRCQSTDKKYNSKQKKSLTLPYSLKESFDSLYISEIPEGTKHLKSPKKTFEKSSMKTSPSKRFSALESKNLPQENETSPVSPSRLSKVKSPNTDSKEVVNGKGKLTVAATPTKKSYPNSIKQVKRSPSKSKSGSINNKESQSTNSPMKRLHSLKSPGRRETLAKSTSQKNTPSKTKFKSPAIEPSIKSSLRSRSGSNSRSPQKREDIGEKKQNFGTPKKSPLKSPGRRPNFSSPFSPKRRFGNKSPRRSSSRSPIKRKARGSKYVKTEFKKFSCTRCKVKFSRKANLDKHLKEHTENKTCPCYICGKQFMSETKMKLHIRYHFSQNVRCRHCDLKFPNVGAMRQHLTETHKDVWLINSKTTENTDESGKSKKKSGQRHKDKIKVVSDLDFRSKEALSELPKPVSIIPKSATKILSPPASHNNFKVLSSPVAVSKKKNAGATLDNSPAPNGYKSKLRYCCYTCKKRFISYYALVQHRRTNHRYNIFSAPSMLLHMKQKVSEEKNPLGNMPILSPPVTPDPYYETVPENVSNNWSTHIDGKSEALKNYRKHIQIKGYRSIHTVAQYKPEVFNWSCYNFPFHYEPYESVIGYNNYKPQPIIAEDLSLNNSIMDSLHNKVNFTPLKLDISSAEAAPILPCMTSPLGQNQQRRFSNDSDSKSMPSLSPTCQNTKFFSDVTESNGIRRDRYSDTCTDDSKSCPSSSGMVTDEHSAVKSNGDQSAFNKTSVKDIENESFVPTLQYLNLVKMSDKETIESAIQAASRTTPAQSYQRDFSDRLKTQSWEGYYSDIEFGKLGDIVNVCSVCYKYFDSEETLVRHQWTRHSSMNCRHLQMEKGHDIDNLFYPWPRNEGMVASSTPVPEDCHTLDSYKCSYCKSGFKNINRLHVHIISCDPKKLYYVEKMSVKERRKQEAKERKATTQNIDTTKKKSAASEMKMKLDKRRKKEKLKKLIREKQTAVFPANNKLPINVNKTQQGLSPRSLREVRRNEMDLLSNSDSRVTRQRKRKNYELLYVPKNHVRRRTATKVVETHQCSGCSSKFRTLFLLERHARKCSEKDKLLFDASIEDHDTNVNSKTQACEFCKKKFTYVKSLANHYNNFCPVKKQKLASEEIEEATVIESEFKSETTQDDVDDEGDADDLSEEPTKRRCGWPKGLKRKNRRKNHSWTITKRKKTSSDESDMDKNNHKEAHKGEDKIEKDSIQDDVEQDSNDSTNILPGDTSADDEPSPKEKRKEVTEDSSTNVQNGLTIKESAATMDIIKDKEMSANSCVQIDTKPDNESYIACSEVVPVSDDQTEISISPKLADNSMSPVSDNHCTEKNQGLHTKPDQNSTQHVQILLQSSNTKLDGKVEDSKSETGSYVDQNPADIADNGYHSDNSNSNSNSKSTKLEASLKNGHILLETKINSELGMSCLNENTEFSTGFKSSCENGHSCTSDLNGSSSIDNTLPVVLENQVPYCIKQSVESVCLISKRNQKVGLFENNKPSLNSTDSSVFYENGINSHESIENPRKELNNTLVPYQNGDENSEMSNESDLMNESDQNGFYSADTETDTDIVCYNGDTDSEESVLSKIINTEPECKLDGSNISPIS